MSLGDRRPLRRFRSPLLFLCFSSVSPLFLPLSPCFLSRCSEFTPPRFRSGIEELGVLEKHRDGAGEGFLWVEQRDGGHSLVSDLAAGRDLFSSLSSVLLLLGVGEKSRMVWAFVRALLTVRVRCTFVCSESSVAHFLVYVGLVLGKP